MNDQYWSWALSIVGVSGFLLAGRKIWWCWYVNIACQALWFTYAVVTGQWGFLVGAVFYTCVFVDNARKWTRDRNKSSNPAIEILQQRVEAGSMSADEVYDAMLKLNRRDL